MQRSQQNTKHTVSQLQGSDPSNLLENPVVDIEVTPNGTGFSIIRRTNQEVGRQTPNHSRPNLSPAQSRDLDWSHLVGELNRNLNQVRDIQITRSASSITVEPDSNDVQGAASVLEALTHVWNKGIKLKSLLFHQKLQQVHEQFKLRLKQLMAQSIRVAQSNFNIYQSVYGNVCKTYNALGSRQLLTRESELGQEVHRYDAQVGNLAKKYQACVENWNFATPQELIEFINALNENNEEGQRIQMKLNEAIDNWLLATFNRYEEVKQACIEFNRKYDELHITIAQADNELFIELTEYKRQIDCLPATFDYDDTTDIDAKLNEIITDWILMDKLLQDANRLQDKMSTCQVLEESSQRIKGLHLSEFSETRAEDDSDILADTQQLNIMENQLQHLQNQQLVRQLSTREESDLNELPSRIGELSAKIKDSTALGQQQSMIQIDKPPLVSTNQHAMFNNDRRSLSDNDQQQEHELQGPETPRYDSV